MSASPALAGRLECQAVTKTGNACSMPPLRGQDYCMAHHPDHQEELKLARQKGAQYRPTAVVPHVDSASPLLMSTSQEVLESISRVATAVMRGELDPRLGNCIGVLLNTALRALDHRLEDRVAELELAVATKLEAQR